MAASAAVISLLLLATVALAAAETAQPQADPAAATGGRTTIKNADKDKLVLSLCRFAVAEHNRGLSKGGAAGNGDPVKVRLAFTGVLAAQRQVVSGVAYYLKVLAREPGAGVGGDRPFDAVVVVKAWVKPKSKKLVSFMPSPK
jgi:hypothetical protein